MRRNLEATGGTIYAERAAIRLAPSIGREQALRLVTEAVAESRQAGVAFVQALRSKVGSTVSSDLLDGIDRPEEYLGSAEALRIQLLHDGEE